MNRVLGWLRLRLGLCQYGQYGCSRQPVGTWTLDGFEARFCAKHWPEFLDDISTDGTHLGTWIPDQPVAA